MRCLLILPLSHLSFSAFPNISRIRETDQSAGLLAGTFDLLSHPIPVRRTGHVGAGAGKLSSGQVAYRAGLVSDNMCVKLDQGRGEMSIILYKNRTRTVLLESLPVGHY